MSDQWDFLMRILETQGITGLLMLGLLWNQLRLYSRCVEERAKINEWIRECFSRELDDDRRAHAALCVLESAEENKS